jgi:hypothetical protein
MKTETITSASPLGLAVLDGIIGALTRGGPGREVEIVVDKKSPTSLSLVKYGSILGAISTSNGWKIPGESAYEALYLARATYEVLMDSIPRFGILPMEDQLSLFVRLKEWPRRKFVTYAKYMTAWPMARYLKNPLPVRPEGFTGSALVFGGKVRRILKNRLISMNDKNTRLWGGYLQGIKRGAAPVSPDFVKEAMLKHRAALGSPSKATAESLLEFEPYFARFFRKFRPSKARLFEASTSASFESKRSAGGARAYIREHLGADDSLLHMVETQPGKVEEVRGLAMPDFSEVLSDAKSSPTDVMVSAVLEPLKVRLITKGNSLRYWVSRFYQKELWGYLQKFPQFSLTGRPLHTNDFRDLRTREDALSLKFEKWVSGDYSAATDNLDIAFTRQAFEESLKKASHYSSDTLDVLRSVLYEQTIHYPDAMNDDGSLDPLSQKTGQLMGSTLSFPILCAVNLVCYWKSLEEYLGHSVKLEQLPVLVNGDDILFRSDDRFYDIWLRNISHVGFTLSLGKNYVHPQILSINSQIFRYKGPDGYVPLGYFNTGLLTGQSKVTGREQARMAPVWALHNEVVAGAVNPSRAHRRFVHYHRTAIEKYTQLGPKTTFNLFLPFQRGGLGFDMVPGLKPNITSFQRRFSSYLMSEINSQLDAGKDPSATQLGLITKKPATGILSLHHVPTLRLDPIVGPLESSVVDYTPRVYTPPALSQAMDPERPELTVKLPKKSTMDRFRKGSFARMSTKEIYSWPYRLTEVLQDLSTVLELDEGVEPLVRSPTVEFDLDKLLLESGATLAP